MRCHHINGAPPSAGVLRLTHDEGYVDFKSDAL